MRDMSEKLKQCLPPASCEKRPIVGDVIGRIHNRAEVLCKLASELEGKASPVLTAEPPSCCEERCPRPPMCAVSTAILDVEELLASVEGHLASIIRRMEL